MYFIKTKPLLDKIFLKLGKKNPKQMEIIEKKLSEIIQGPHHYKNLKKPLQYLKRIHVDKSFVLTFSINEEEKTITIENYKHHDDIYK